MTHPHDLTKLEDYWLPIIVPYITHLFATNPIPSHDHWHHLRTWKHAKNLLLAVSSTYKLPSKLPEQLLIACLFHDSGLTQTLDEYHGTASAEICQAFFPTPPLPTFEFRQVVEAIKHHDDKSYQQHPQSPEDLYTLLTTADDLDAFGALGLVRYIEIYSMRGLNRPHLIEKAQQNLKQRQQHFQWHYNKFPSVFSFYHQKANYALHLFQRFANPDDKEAQNLYNQIKKEILREHHIHIASTRPSSALTKEFLQQIKADMETTV